MAAAGALSAGGPGPGDRFLIMRLNFRTTIAGRLVRVVAGTNTQTVNICTAANQIGAYEAIYRFPITSAIDDTELVPCLTSKSCANGWRCAMGSLRRGQLPLGI